jgi:hypothetical protein
LGGRRSSAAPPQPGGVALPDVSFGGLRVPVGPLIASATRAAGSFDCLGVGATPFDPRRLLGGGATLSASPWVRCRGAIERRGAGAGDGFLRPSRAESMSGNSNPTFLSSRSAYVRDQAPRNIPQPSPRTANCDQRAHAVAPIRIQRSHRGTPRRRRRRGRGLEDRDAAGRARAPCGSSTRRTARSPKVGLWHAAAGPVSRSPSPRSALGHLHPRSRCGEERIRQEERRVAGARSSLRRQLSFFQPHPG